MRLGKAPQDTAGKTENFFTRNVRLITFLCCLAVFLTFFGPISIFYIDDYIESLEQDTRRDMTLEDLRSVSDAGRTLNMRALEQFKGEKSENGEGTESTVTYNIPVGERYFLMAGFYAESGKVYYLTLTDLEAHTDLDLLDRTSDLEAFLN